MRDICHLICGHFSDKAHIWITQGFGFHILDQKSHKCPIPSYSERGHSTVGVSPARRKATASRLRCGLHHMTRYCVSVRPNHSGFTAWLCRQGQRYPCAVWTKELRLEPVATESSGHRPWAGTPAMPDLSRRSGPGTWPLLARPSYRRRRQARRSQGGHSRDWTWLTELS